ncbi:hypothetical protein KJK41_03530 [Bacillus haikouensis]|nr:hypothetical protein KJK41_03530 [Bacillus haikouensis]
MSAKKTAQSVNWTVLGLLILCGLVFAGSTFGSLMNATPDELDGMQSRIENRWNQDLWVFAGIVGACTLMLIVLWKRLFPYNVPLAIILGGFGFELLFQATVTGWAGLAGLIGLAVALVVGVLMILVYAVGEKWWRVREK